MLVDRLLRRSGVSDIREPCCGSLHAQTKEVSERPRYTTLYKFPVPAVPKWRIPEIILDKNADVVRQDFKKALDMMATIGTTSNQIFRPNI
jgi:hypothetical protein